MRALDPEVVDAVYQAVEALIPTREVSHPLGCGRRRISDRLCFEGMLIRFMTGCSWQNTERLLRPEASDTTQQERRDKWITAGVSDALVEEAIAGDDRIVELDRSDVSIDGSQAKARCGGEGTGRNPTDRGTTGWKWSIAGDARGIPIGRVIDAANRHAPNLVDPTLEMIHDRGLRHDIDTVHLDKGYDYRFVGEPMEQNEIDDANIARKKMRGQPQTRRPYRISNRCVVERTNSWLEAFGQLRRNTDRRIVPRSTQFALALVTRITARLIDWRNRNSPQSVPIR